LATPKKASPSWRKSKVLGVNSPTAKTPSLHSAGKSRKSLTFSGGILTLSSTKKEDEMLSKLNVDDLPQTGLQVKIHVYDSFRNCDYKSSLRITNKKFGQEHCMRKLA